MAVCQTSLMLNLVFNVHETSKSFFRHWSRCWWVLEPLENSSTTSPPCVQAFSAQPEPQWLSWKLWCCSRDFWVSHRHSNTVPYFISGWYIRSNEQWLCSMNNFIPAFINLWWLSSSSGSTDFAALISFYQQAPSSFIPKINCLQEKEKQWIN